MQDPERRYQSSDVRIDTKISISPIPALYVLESIILSKYRYFSNLKQICSLLEIEIQRKVTTITLVYLNNANLVGTTCSSACQVMCVIWHCTTAEHAIATQSAAWHMLFSHAISPTDWIWLNASEVMCGATSLP